jgi:hypothetical protein
MAKIESYEAATPADGDYFLGTDISESNDTVNFTFSSVNTYLSGKKVSVPATASSTGTAGDYAVESGYAYFCVATDTWERVAIATW